MKQEQVDRMFAGILDRARAKDAARQSNAPHGQQRRERIAPPIHPAKEYTDEEWSGLGQKMAANPKAITTNIEGLAYLDYTSEQRRLLRDRYGCCGEEADTEGYCFGLGKCPRHDETRACVNFAADFIAWMDQINEQTSLAAVAVRLSDSSSLTSEVSNV